MRQACGTTQRWCMHSFIAKMFLSPSECMPGLQISWIMFRSASWALHLGNRIASCPCILHTVHKHNARSTSLTFVWQSSWLCKGIPLWVAAVLCCDWSAFGVLSLCCCHCAGCAVHVMQVAWATRCAIGSAHVCSSTMRTLWQAVQQHPASVLRRHVWQACAAAYQNTSSNMSVCILLYVVLYVRPFQKYMLVCLYIYYSM